MAPLALSRIMKPKSSIMLYLVLTLIISLGLSAVLPRFAVGYGSFEVFVETNGEMKDFVVFLQFRGTFDATKFNSNQTTEDARYFLGVESSKNGITNETLVNLVGQHYASETRGKVRPV